MKQLEFQFDEYEGRMFINHDSEKKFYVAWTKKDAWGHYYLHTDGVWRDPPSGSCYFPSREAAQAMFDRIGPPGLLDDFWVAK